MIILWISKYSFIQLLNNGISINNNDLIKDLPLKLLRKQCNRRLWSSYKTFSFIISEIIIFVSFTFLLIIDNIGDLFVYICKERKERNCLSSKVQTRVYLIFFSHLLWIKFLLLPPNRTQKETKLVLFRTLPTVLPLPVA